MASANHKKQKLTLDEKSQRFLSLQSLVLRYLRHVMLFSMVACLPVCLYVLTLPEQRKVTELRQKLELAQQEEKSVKDENDRITRELSAYRTNPQYLEIIARDHLNMYKEGETVIKIVR